jgi:hypothetical protein
MAADTAQKLSNNISTVHITNAELPGTLSVSIHSLIVDFHDITSRVAPGGELAASFAAAIEKSRLMLALPEDWDAEGSPAYQEETWQRAVDFLVRIAVEFWGAYGIVPAAPRIRKGPLGSIDLHWLTPKRELLINVPVEAGTPFDFYGDDRQGDHQVKGALNPAEENHWLMRWLTV